MPNKEEEKQVAIFFCAYLNRIYNFDYNVKLNIEENKKDSDIDAWLISDSSRYPNINLQIVTSDGKIREVLGRLRSISKRTGQHIVTESGLDVKFEKWIPEIIEQKTLKYPRISRINMVLLVEFTLGSFNRDYAKKFFQRFNDYDFMGIYAIHLSKPNRSSVSPHNGQNGQIIPIKSMKKNKLRNQKQN